MTDIAPGQPLQHRWRALSLPAQRLSQWRARQRSSPAWSVTVGLILAIVVLPVAALIVLALTAGDNVWPHLLRTVLPASLLETALLLSGVGALTLVTGAGTAWIVTMYRFPGRAVL